MVAVILAALALTTGSRSQGLSPTPPPGWSISSDNTGWLLTPGDLPPGATFAGVIAKPQRAKSDLKAYFENLWTGLATGGTAQRQQQPVEQDIAKWHLIRQLGTLSQGQKSLIADVTALQLGDQQISVVLLTNSSDYYSKYGPAFNAAVVAMLEGVTATPAAGGNLAAGGGFALSGTFPQGWSPQQGQGFQSGRLVTQEGRDDRFVVLLPSEPLQGSLEQTFKAIWSREAQRGQFIFQNPGLVSPEQPNPLRMRLKNGLAVWWEGGEGHCQGVTPFECYIQIYMVVLDGSVEPVVAFYSMGNESTNEATRAGVMQYLESLHPSATVSKTSLFSTSECVGKWKLNLAPILAGFYSSSTGAYLGDAGSGGMETLTLKSDGLYTKSFVGKSGSYEFTHSENGSWHLDDNVLSLKPSHASDGKLAKQTYRIYGKTHLGGGTQLMLGASTRVPTDALESGAMLEIVNKGGALFRYESLGS